MSNVDPVFGIALLMVFSILVAGAIVVPLWVFLHYKLSSRLDDILFREPFFKKVELVNYLYWPLNSVKSLNYIGLVAAPRIAKRKRFRDYNGSLPLTKPIIAACKLHFFLLCYLALMFVVFNGYLVLSLYVL